MAIYLLENFFNFSEINLIAFFCFYLLTEILSTLKTHVKIANEQLKIQHENLKFVKTLSTIGKRNYD
jgi:hypothetical protein